MSHLKTKQDYEMIFEQADYNRLRVPLIVSYIAIVASIILALITLIVWSSTGDVVTMTYFALEGLVLFAAIAVVVFVSSSVNHRRRIRDALGGLVDELNFRFSHFKSGDSIELGTAGRSKFIATRRDIGVWLIQVFSPNEAGVAELRFEGVLMKYRLALVENPEMLVQFTAYKLALLVQMKNYLEAEGEFSGIASRTGSSTHARVQDERGDKSFSELGLGEQELTTVE